MSRRRRKTAKRAPEPVEKPATPQPDPLRPNKPFLWIAIVLLAVWVTFLVRLALAT
jgi:hypothetical protein